MQCLTRMWLSLALGSRNMVAAEVSICPCILDLQQDERRIKHLKVLIKYLISIPLYNPPWFIFQYLTKKLGVDPVFFGYLQTTFAVVQLCGGPVYGRFGDMFGGRAAMALAFACASVSYFVLGIADTFFWLFLSRLPSVFMHAMQGEHWFYDKQ